LCIVTEDPPARPPAPKIDASAPHSARIWNYWLGGKDNYPVDREAGDRYREIYPQIVDTARAARYFLARTIRYLAGEAGIRQFLDVGTGLPTVDNTHEKVTGFILAATGGNWGRVRSREEVAAFFDGLEIRPPGLVKAIDWRPDGREEAQSPEWFEFGGVARKP
jgi:hypothetical protein